MSVADLSLADVTRIHSSLCTAKRRSDGGAAAEAIGEIVGQVPPQPIPASVVDQHIRSLGARIQQKNQEKKPKATKREPRKLIMRNVASIDDDGTTYLWKRRFARSAINVIFSRPGRGKSTLAANLASSVSRGQQWPDGTTCESGSVLYLKGEGTDAAIRDRLKLAGANLARIEIVSKTDNEDDPMIDLGEDALALGEAVDSLHDPRLIVIDTLDSMYPSMRMIDNANIRKNLWPLQELAEQKELCVIVLAHTNKGGYSDPLDRLSGGRAIGGAARSVWYLGKTDPKAEQVILAPVKCNDFRPARAIEYEIIGVSEDQPGAIRWGAETDTTAYELDRPQEQQKADKTAQVAEWIQTSLASGPKPTSELERDRLLAEFGDFVWKKAKRVAEVKSIAQKGSSPPVWWTCLPGQTPPATTDSLDRKGTTTLDSSSKSNVVVGQGSGEQIPLHSSAEAPGSPESKGVTHAKS